ncbi:MAG: inositol monophosphatase [Bacteroidetes bacterium]|nr:MAG: inositol monophosphatase [Bacteroidota bacterium]
MNLENLKKSVIDLAVEVGAFIVQELQSFDRSKTEFKGINNLVSYVDKQAEHRIVEKLKELLPESGFIAEEGTGNPVENGYNWIIDPLDGTTNFIHAIPIFSISIALMKKDEILLGVVYEPNLKECFHAIKGQGAFLNDKKIQVSSATTLSESLIATGFPYQHQDKMKNYLNLLYAFIERTHGFRRMGSAAIDLAYVAAGRLEAFYEYNLNAWDVAAGALLVQEAGGTVSDFAGENNFVFGRQILATGKIHEQMRNIIKEHFL